MLGISVYLSEPIELQEDYIRKLNNKGFNSIFTSLHIPEDNPALYKNRLKELGELAKENTMELIADISPKSLQYLECTWDNAEKLQTWGLTGLRLDYGIDENIMIDLSNKMKIALNASTLDRELLDRLKRKGLKISSIEAWHNFYPRPETGLDRFDFHQQNSWLSDEGIKLMAFIPGDQKLRGPLYKGLPTLEDHRYANPFAAYNDLKVNEGIDKILVGDISISEFTLEQFSRLNTEGYFLLRAKSFIDDLELQECVGAIQTNRLDTARDCIRSMESRMFGQMGDRKMEPYNTNERLIGSITIDNQRYGRYQGEVQITKCDLEADEKVNVIGRIIDEDIDLLQYIRGGKKFKIQWI